MFVCKFNATTYSVPEREFEVRKDLRNERIFSIDPVGAKDVDDALSVTINEDGTYDIGVHIADVSFFVKPNTALDRDARKRATSVYLVQRAVPMLPPALSDELCSILPGQERLAFSVIFTMTKEAKVVKKWFGRTIVKYVPCGLLSTVSDIFPTDLRLSSPTITLKPLSTARLSVTCLLLPSITLRTSSTTSKFWTTLRSR